MRRELHREWSQDELDRLVDRHHAELRRFVRRRLSDASAVDDVLAETFCVAWRRRNEIPNPATPWLMRVCANVISTHERGARRRVRLRARLSALREPEARDPAELVDRQSQIRAAFNSIGESHREVLRLVAWDDLSIADAAAVCGCTPGAFRVRLHRARNELAKQLEQAGHEPVTMKRQAGTA